MSDHEERGTAVDMSEAAVGRRLEAMGQLYRLGQSLKTARWMGPVEETTSENDTGVDATRPSP